MKAFFHLPDTPASEAQRERRRRSMMLAVAGILVLPLLWRGNSCGHDFDFHLESWMEVVRQWKQGVFYPHWVESANYGAGEPRFVFYPPASWMLGAVLGLVLPWAAVPAVWILLVLTGCAFSMYLLARQWMTRDAAAIAASVYILNPYVLFVVYERAAFAELMAGIWMPLLFLYALRRAPSLAALTLVIATVWLTNAPAAVMACYTLAVISLVAAIAERAWWPVLRAAAAVSIGIGLSAFYLVPAALERAWVVIDRAIVPGMRVEDSFLFGHTGEAFHDRVLDKASWIAVAMLIMVAAAIVAGFRQRRGEEQQKRRLRWPLLTLSGLILILLVGVSEPVWKHAPELKFLQFPWRWLLVLGLVLALLVGAALRGVFRDAPSPRAITVRSAWVLLIGVLMAFGANHICRQPCDEEDNVAAQAVTFQEGGFEGTDEYTTRDADNGAIQQDLPRVRVLDAADAEIADSTVTQNPEWQEDKAVTLPAKIDVRLWKVEHKTLVVNSPRPGFAVLTLMDYPAWRVHANGELLAVRPHREDGLLTVPVVAGTTEIDVRYGGTLDAVWGRGISLGALLIWFSVAARERKASLLETSASQAGRAHRIS